MRPTLWSERPAGERNGLDGNWFLGLAGIYAEAEASDWSRALSDADADTALRFVPVELGEFPSWLADLYASHPTRVDAVLGTELTAELAMVTPPELHTPLLQRLSHTTAAFAQPFVPRLLDWIEEIDPAVLCDAEHRSANEWRLQAVLSAILPFSAAAALQRVQAAAERHLAEGLDAPFAECWLQAFFWSDATRPTAWLEAQLDATGTVPHPRGVGVMAALFGERHSRASLRNRVGDFALDTRIRLVRLAYRHVPPETDPRHTGTFSPGIRDAAQDARNVLLDSVLNATGAEAWSAKLALADAPELAHFRSRAIEIARERAAEEADGDALTESDVVAVERRGEAPPRTTNDMFLLLQDRLDDIDDMLEADSSPREGWARHSDEYLVRRDLARELRSRANGMYTVDEEAVTAGEKETDIRLRSTGSAQEGVIELKLGQKARSVRVLQKALRQQLVDQYMRPYGRRSGCLLITLPDRREWRHPETRAEIDGKQLIALLQDTADQIMAFYGEELRLVVRGLDLRMSRS